MSRFSTALKTALDDLGWTQTRYAAEVQTTRPKMSSYVSGRTHPEASMMDRMCAALPPPQRAAVICALLEDALPASGRELVTIQAYVGRARKPMLLSSLPSDVRSALEKLGALAAREPETGKLLVQFVEAITQPRK